MKLLSLLLICTTVFGYQQIDLSREDTKNFPGGWSLVPEEGYLALKHCTFDETFKILEFGSGRGTELLAQLLKEKGIPFEYHTIEHDASFEKEIDGVYFYLYDTPPKQVSLPYDFPKFDLVIVDGPHGVCRADWYEKFQPYTRSGTVILVDDFHHYTEFGKALDTNFSYQTVIEFNEDYRWKQVNEGLEPSPLPSQGHTFKIVIVL